MNDSKEETRIGQGQRQEDHQKEEKEKQDENETTTLETSTKKKETKKKQPRRVIRRRRGGKGVKSSASQQDDEDNIIDPILYEKVMKESSLPKDYNFEIKKCVRRIYQIIHDKTQKGHSLSDDNEKQQQDEQKQEQPSSPSSPPSSSPTIETTIKLHIALQMPEGLLMYSSIIGDVLKKLTSQLSSSSATVDIDISILGDVTYGACCIDDIGANIMGCDLLIHYGHSCLVPIQHTAIPVLYVFVEISIDVQHLVNCVYETIIVKDKDYCNNNKQNENKNDGDDETKRKTKASIYLLGTIQFRNALVEAKTLFNNIDIDVIIPQAKPLSPGEVLGCTSPKLISSEKEGNIIDTVIFVADGRFHLESTMISNPHIKQYLRYDPYSKTLTEEKYDNKKMVTIRTKQIINARKYIYHKSDDNNNNNKEGSGSSSFCSCWCIILGTLGRQGNPSILNNIRLLLKKNNIRSFIMLLSEITPNKLRLLEKKVDVFVQVACPRLSVDWGHYFNNKPILSPYEVYVCFNNNNNNNDNNNISNNDENEKQQQRDEEEIFDFTSPNNTNYEYPMDFYTANKKNDETKRPWSNYYNENKERQMTN